MTDRDEIARLTRERDEARAMIAAMREAVLEFEHRPSSGEFISYMKGTPYATPPDRVRGYFEALDERWKSPDVRRWSEEFRTSHDRALAAESSLSSAREDVARLTREIVACAEKEGDASWYAVWREWFKERDAARAEVERLTAERDEALAIRRSP